MVRFTEADLTPCDGLIGHAPCPECLTFQDLTYQITDSNRCILCGKIRPDNEIEACSRQIMPYANDCATCGYPAPEPPITPEGDGY